MKMAGWKKFRPVFTFKDNLNVHFVIKCGIKVIFSGNNAESEKNA